MVEEQEKKITLKLPKFSLWVLTTIICLVFALIALTGWPIELRRTGGVSITGMAIAITGDQAAKIAVDYVNNNLVQTGQVSLVSVEELSGVYKVVTSYQDQEIPVYITKDGLYLFISQPLDTSQEIPKEPEQQQQPQEIPKKEKPDVDLYIFSYCPAGSAALDSFSEVASFLKEYANFKVKFFSHMHGEYERQQNIIQECIQRVAPDKYWDYSKQFVEEVYQKCASSRSTDCDEEESIALMTSVGINSNEVMDCLEQNGETYYQQDIEDASNLQLQYSPSFVINGVYSSNINRSPEGIKSAVCSAFNKPPEECSQTLSGSQSSNPSGGCG